MIEAAIGFVFLVLMCGVVALPAIGAFKEWNNGDNATAAMLGLVSLGMLLLFLIILGMATGEINTGPADGCYQIVTTSGSGISSSGDYVSTSGKTYIPIACPR